MWTIPLGSLCRHGNLIQDEGSESSSESSPLILDQGKLKIQYVLLY